MPASSAPRTTAPPSACRRFLDATRSRTRPQVTAREGLSDVSRVDVASRPVTCAPPAARAARAGRPRARRHPRRRRRAVPPCANGRMISRALACRHPAAAEIGEKYTTPSLTSVTSPHSERPLIRALITSPTATRSNRICPYPCALAPRGRGESCRLEVFGALRRTLTACREDACRHRFEQNRASTRRPPGIGPPHHEHVSGGLGGGEGGRSFSRAREAACRHRLEQ